MEADKPGRPNPRYESKSLDVGLFDICTPLWRLVPQLVPSGNYDPKNSRRCPFKSVHISPWQTLTPSPPDKIRKQAFGYRAVWYRHSPGGSGGAVGAWRGGPPTHGTAWETSEGSSTLTVQLSPALNTRSDTEPVGKVSQRSVYVRYNRWSAHRARCVSSCFCAPGHF